MIRLSRWKVIVCVLATIFGVLFTLPNVLPQSALAQLPPWMPHQKLNLGLDLQGGSYLLYEVDITALKKERLNNLIEDVRTTLRENRIVFSDLGLVNGQLMVRITDPAQADEAYKQLQTLGQPLPTGGREVTVQTAPDRHIRLFISDRAMEQEAVQAVKQTIEIIRRRVDALGTREPNIVQQGSTRIVVEAPGEADPNRLRAVIGQTAKLTFQMVDDTVTPEDIAAGRVPPDSIILPEEDGPEQQLAVKRRALVSGDMLTHASAGYDQFNRPDINFRFNGQGTRRFAEATSQNVGKRFAIVLDNKIISAPNIQEPITGGSGQITGNFTLEEANNLALLLRSGALPAPLKVIEQRTVGAELGADAIHAGQVSTFIGGAAIFLFVILAYGLFGWFAAAALVVNGLLIVAFMSLTQATLTLPGIAGLILTLAVAVDANVLIYERARDEARSGRSIMASIDEGYSKAMGTIIDANLTSLIAALIMFQFGSGPVRGFAWTLSIGIFTSVFTSVLITQVLIAWWFRAARPKRLPILEETPMREQTR
jgi:preprotein translocase subunit SecD